MQDRFNIAVVQVELSSEAILFCFPDGLKAGKGAVS